MPRSMRTLAVWILPVCVILGLSLTQARAQTGGDTGYGTCADGSRKRPGEDCRERLCNSGWAQAHGLGSYCGGARTSSENSRRQTPINEEVPEVVDPKAREKALADERARAAAEEKRRQDEQFQQDKADVLTTMKGVSSSGADLKPIVGDSNTYADTAPPLKGFDNVPRSPSLSDADRIYWHTVIPPAACFVAEKLTANALCTIVYADEMVEALREADPRQAIKKLILKKLITNGTTKIIIISLAGGEGLRGDSELMQAMYEALQKVFDQILQVITTDMVQDPTKAAWLERWAKLDSDAVETLKRRLFTEKMANIRVSQNYLQKNPNSPGIRLNCGPACRQLLQAARGIGALE